MSSYASRFLVRHWVGMLAMAGPWLLLLSVLVPSWAVLEQYSYGWIVPILAGVATVLRWKWRPVPGPRSWAAYVFLAGGAVALLPIWLLLQPSPDWRLLLWALAGAAGAISVGILQLAGGWSWVRHFAWPITLIFTAIPWPMPVENQLAGGLSRGVCAVSVGVLNAEGVLAVARGSVIELKEGLLDVDHACSGIRSLQAALMAALALGELYGFSLARRGALVIAAAVVAVATNTGRACFLAARAAAAGRIGAVDEIHDAAGLTTMTIGLAGVFGIAWWLARKSRAEREIVAAGSSHEIPKVLPWLLAGWLLVVVGGTEWWFAIGPKVGEPAWIIRPPAQSTPMTVSSSAAEQLGFDESASARWADASGCAWVMYAFTWKPGAMRTRVMARLHRPEYCLPSTGVKLVGERGGLRVHAGEITLELRAYTFEFNGRPMYVYHGIWQNRGLRNGPTPPFADSFAKASWQAVLWRERNVGQQSAEIGLFGYRTVEEADAALRQGFPGLIHTRK